MREARSANSSPVSNFTEFAVLLTVADTCRGDLELNPLPALQGCAAPMGGAPGLLACGTAQLGIYQVH
jgi:hypothetical protein